MDQLAESIKRHEGFRDKIYLDTEGKPTGGWGHHFWVGSRLPLEACEALFLQDLRDARAQYIAIPQIRREKLNPTRERVITEMIFNMNLQRVLGFKKMWECVENGDFDGATRELLDSKWANQVGARALELAEIFKIG